MSEDTTPQTNEWRVIGHYPLGFNYSKVEHQKQLEWTGLDRGYHIGIIMCLLSSSSSESHAIDKQSPSVGARVESFPGFVRSTSSEEICY